MNKFKFFAWVIAALLVMIIFFTGVNSIMGTGKLPAAGVWLDVESGDVFVREAGQVGWRQIFVNRPLIAGDAVKTGAGTQARIVFFDSQEMIMDENTEVVLTKGEIDQQNPFLTKVNVDLIRGQVWSRVLELLHPSALFEVCSGAIKATARGTTFNFKRETALATVAVLQGAVSMSLPAVDQAAVDVSPGQIFTYDFTTQTSVVEKAVDRKLFAEVKDDQWMIMNVLRDRDFETALNTAQDLLLKNVGSLPNAKLYRVKRWLENVTGRIIKKNSVSADHAAKRAIEASVMMRRDMRLALRLAEENAMANNFTFLRLQAMDPGFRRLLTRQPAARAYFYDNVFSAEQKAFVQKKIEAKEDYTERKLVPLPEELNGVESG